MRVLSRCSAPQALPGRRVLCRGSTSVQCGLWNPVRVRAAPSPHGWGCPGPTRDDIPDARAGRPRRRRIHGLHVTFTPTPHSTLNALTFHSGSTGFRHGKASSRKRGHPDISINDVSGGTGWPSRRLPRGRTSRATGELSCLLGAVALPDMAPEAAAPSGPG